MIAGGDESYGSGGKGDVGEFLTIKSFDEDLMGKGCDGKFQLISQMGVNEITLCSGVQEGLT